VEKGNKPIESGSSIMTWNIYFWIFGSLFIINIIYLVYLKIDQVKKENKLNERLR